MSAPSNNGSNMTITHKSLPVRLACGEHGILLLSIFFMDIIDPPFWIISCVLGRNDYQPSTCKPMLLP
jgi:hypothetical protein